MINRNSAKECNYNIIFLSIILIFVLFPIFFGNNYIIYILNFFNYFYLMAFIIKILLFSYGIFLYKNIDYKKSAYIEDNDMDIYTILVPLYKEKELTIIGLLSSINNLDYPKEKIDLKLIIENDDKKTKEIVNKISENYKNFEIIVVPDGDIKTKPRACNYALNSAKGKYLTIYDAEDRPEKYQLKKAISKFKSSSENLVCLQAALNYYNKYENCYTKCFSVEYSMWFDFTLRVLEKIGTFFPLGGTSNHFKTDKLKEIGGWDSYNVTEDADLGVVIARSGYKVSFLDSITEEEAPTNFRTWIKQRSRWIKGFIQTFCVHVKNPIKLYKELGIKNFIIFIIFILISFLYFLTIPFILLLVLILAYQSKDWNILNLELLISFIVILSIYWIIVFKNNLKGMFLNSFIFPFYWLLHSIASIISFIQIIKKPFYWDKTEHGLSKIKNFEG